MDKGQIIRYSKAELGLINRTFADNEELLLALYKFMLQLDLSEQEWIALQGLKKGDVLDILRKQFLPTFNDDAPIGQMIDLFMTVKTEETDKEDVYISGMARQVVVDYLEGRLQTLEDKEPEEINLFDLQEVTEDKELFHINLKARNTIINHCIQRIVEIQTLAGTKDETDEEREKRLKLNSNK